MKTSLKKSMIPFAYIIGKCLNINSALFEIYRNKNFKGKLLISGFLDRSKFLNGTYKCGGVKYEIDFKDQIQEMIYLGTYERDDLAFLKNYIQKDWICLDIGANVGFYTLNLSKLVGEKGRIYAIEPSPSNYEILQKNVRLNDLDNVFSANIALSSQDGEFTFSTSPDRNSGWGRLGKWKAAKSEVVVETKTLDNFVQEQGVSEIDFLKIDIEGHELEFLKGAEKTLKSRLISRIMVEYCGFVLEPQGISLKNYVEKIEGFGYVPRYFNLDKIKQAKRNSYKSQKEILNLIFERKKMESA